MPIKFPLSSLVSSLKCPRTVRTFHHLPRVASITRQYTSRPELVQCHSSQSSDSPVVHSFFEQHTSTWRDLSYPAYFQLNFRRQYIVSDPVTREAALIDTVLDYDPSSGAISTTTADGILSFIEKHGLTIKYILCVRRRCASTIQLIYSSVKPMPTPTI